MKSKEEIIREKLELKLGLEEGHDEHFHVLAVDDSLIERKMLEKLLTISSYHVTCVESGDKALEYLGLVDRRPHIDDHDHDVDDDDDVVNDSANIHRSLSAAADHQQGQGMRVNLIMTDYSMPGITGYDLLKRVKGSSWKDVPVIVMSSENVPSRIDMCLEEGAEDFLLKPVRLSDLKKLEPHISKFTSTSHCCGKMNSTSSSSSKDLLDETRSCNILVANDNNNYDYKEGIIIADYTSNFDKEKTKVGDEHFDRRPKPEGLTTV